VPGDGQVLQFIQSPQRRGAETFALQLSKALRDLAWQSTVISLFPGDDRFVGSAEATGVWGGSLGARAGGALSPGLLRRVIHRIGQAHRPVVQANGAATLKYLATARVLMRGRWPLLYRAIGMPSYWRRDPIRAALYRGWFRQADVVVAVCQRAADELVHAVGLPSRQVRVIPNGVDAAPFLAEPAGARARVRAEARVEPGEVVIAHVGSLSPEKNQRALIRLTGALRDRGLPARLWLIGDGPQRPSIEAWVREAALGERVWMPGVRQDVADLLAGADLLVLPSLTEGMPAAAIEAGLSGLPVVAYRVGGIEEVVQHARTGVLVAPDDEAALEAEVARLALDRDLRSAMGAAARAACQAFEIGRIAVQYAEVYRGLRNGRGPDA
jgi:glycosyltransferase involved in cell wall biosynthesis